MATPGTNKPASRRGWLEHIHLIWLVGLFWQAVYDPGFGWVNILVTLGGLIIFLTLYMLAHAHPYSRSERLRNIGIFAALGLLTAPFNSWSSVYLIFAAGTAGYLQPPRLGFRVIWVFVGGMPVFLGVGVWGAEASLYSGALFRRYRGQAPDVIPQAGVSAGGKGRGGGGKAARDHG